MARAGVEARPWSTVGDGITSTRPGSALDMAHLMGSHQLSLEVANTSMRSDSRGAGPHLSDTQKQLLRDHPLLSSMLTEPHKFSPAPSQTRQLATHDRSKELQSSFAEVNKENRHPSQLTREHMTISSTSVDLRGRVQSPYATTAHQSETGRLAKPQQAPPPREDIDTLFKEDVKPSDYIPAEERLRLCSEPVKIHPRGSQSRDLSKKSSEGKEKRKESVEPPRAESKAETAKVKTTSESKKPTRPTSQLHIGVQVEDTANLNVRTSDNPLLQSSHKDQKYYFGMWDKSFQGQNTNAVPQIFHDVRDSGYQSDSNTGKKSQNVGLKPRQATKHRRSQSVENLSETLSMVKRRFPHDLQPRAPSSLEFRETMHYQARPLTSFSDDLDTDNKLFTVDRPFLSSNSPSLHLPTRGREIPGTHLSRFAARNHLLRRTNVSEKAHEIRRTVRSKDIEAPKPPQAPNKDIAKDSLQQKGVPNISSTAQQQAIPTRSPAPVDLSQAKSYVAHYQPILSKFDEAKSLFTGYKATVPLKEEAPHKEILYSEVHNSTEGKRPTDSTSGYTRPGTPGHKQLPNTSSNPSSMIRNEYLLMNTAALAREAKAAAFGATYPVNSKLESDVRGQPQVEFKPRPFPQTIPSTQDDIVLNKSSSDSVHRYGNGPSPYSTLPPRREEFSFHTSHEPPKSREHESQTSQNTNKTHSQISKREDSKTPSGGQSRTEMKQVESRLPYDRTFQDIPRLPMDKLHRSHSASGERFRPDRKVTAPYRPDREMIGQYRPDRETTVPPFERASKWSGWTNSRDRSSQLKEDKKYSLNEQKRSAGNEKEQEIPLTEEDDLENDLVKKVVQKQTNSFDLVNYESDYMRRSLSRQYVGSKAFRDAMYVPKVSSEDLSAGTSLSNSAPSLLSPRSEFLARLRPARNSRTPEPNMRDVRVVRSLEEGRDRDRSIERLLREHQFQHHTESRSPSRHGRRSVSPGSRSVKFAGDVMVAHGYGHEPIHVTSAPLNDDRREDSLGFFDRERHDTPRR